MDNESTKKNENIEDVEAINFNGEEVKEQEEIIDAEFVKNENLKKDENISETNNKNKEFKTDLKLNNKILNLANKITFIRIGLIPFIVIFMFLAIKSLVFATKGQLKSVIFFQFFALILFVLASLTDYFDGKIARNRKEVTTLGKFLDTLADKLLVLVVIFLIVIGYNTIYSTDLIANLAQESKIENGAYIYLIIVFLIILVREFIITAFRQIAASKNVILQADKYGKAKTAITLITIGFQMLSPIIICFKLLKEQDPIKISKYYNIFCMILWTAVLILTLISGINYIYQNRKVLEK